MEHTALRRIRDLSCLLVCCLILVLGSSVIPADARGQADPVLTYIRSIPGAFVKEIEAPPPYRRAYEIWLNQPVDHTDPAGRTFQQRFFLSHLDFASPMVMCTEGYAATWPKKRELATLLKANKLEVEHRYFGVSIPDPMDLTYLTVEQAASDHHRIISLLKPIYAGKWVTTGKSRGGQCAFIHRSLYPDDVDATVAYVAPIMFSREDPRLLAALEANLGRDTLDRLEEIQVALLQNKEEVMERVFPASIADLLYIDAETLMEYTVAVLPFLVESPEADSLEIPPPDADIAELCAFFADHVHFSHYNRSSRQIQQSLYYQAATQIGYFGYPRDHLEPYLSADQTIDCSLLTYPGPIPPFQAAAMRGVQERLKTVGNNIIYIYGENDLWTACSVELSGQVNALKIIHPDGDHKVRIQDLTPSDRALVLSTLDEWLEMEIDF